MKIESRISGLARAARLCRRHVSVALWVATAAVFTTTACSDDSEQPAPQTDGRTAIIYLNFKTNAAKQAAEMDALQSPDTRAPMTRAVDETEIRTVDVLSFKADASEPNNIKKGTFFYRSKGVYTQISPGQGKVEVKLISFPEAQTLVVLANVREQVDALGAAFGEQKEEVMKRLLLPATADGTPDFTNGMPMWGELPAQTVNESYGQTVAGAPTVTMIRSVVKFTLTPVDPPVTHGFEKIHVYNHRTGGRVSPDNYDNAGFKVLAPTVPAGATAAAGNNINTNIPYFMTGDQKSFYLFESDSHNKVTATSALEATCLVLAIKSTKLPAATAYGYYRIDFKDYNTGRYLDLLRNHDYRIEVESVEGLPANTPDEAYKGQHTLKCRIVPWNEVQEEVKVEGNKRLTVDKRVFQFPGDPNVAGETGGTQTLTLSTENTGGWRIDGKPDWVNLSQTSGADGTPATVTLSVGVNPGRTDRTAVMTLVAGNLTYKIHLSQPDACGKNGVPKKMHIGNNDYYTHRFGGQCWMLENSREGTPDHILPPLPGRPHQRYLWNAWGYQDAVKVGLPAGWAGPTYTDVYNLKKATFPDGTGSGIGTSKWLWLQWQNDPGVVSYHPTFDGNGPLVEPPPYWASIGGRTPDKFWPGDYQNWEYRRVPRLLSYIQKQQDNISAFWSHQWITDAGWDSGVHEIPAANGQKAHAYMGRMPVVTVDVGIPNPHQCCIQIAPDLREPGTHKSAYERAKDCMTIYWWVDPATGENWSHGYDFYGTKGKLRKASGHVGWFGPYDMPWRFDPSEFYTTMLTRDGATYADLFTGGSYYYKTRQSSSYPYTYEKDFYPGANELSTRSTELPRSNYWLDFETQTGLGAYMENLLPVRFVRRD